ncbi:mitochondrial import inner membrane translocase subunit TIM50-C-like [Sitophilus oryzae]|uniref:Mitochondrial import inner membrane translocase subunit TIM50 n=1 Tax=Sitophilus oryzae TaxID=7048 RepID=A0A6J2XT02_SITOR|nr:mitochondrial import inner membrane translocase subunit TIM50-C-like [Sitophilus oryzae]
MWHRNILKYSQIYFNVLRFSSKVSDAGNKKPVKGLDEKIPKRKSRGRSQLVYLLSALSFTCLSAYIIISLGAPEEDDDGIPIRDEFCQYHPIDAYLLRTYRELCYYRRLLKEPSTEKLLPDPLKEPYIQPKYTLVLELNEVLVHSEWTHASGMKYKKRPLIEQFLESVKDHYEIIIFTQEPGMIAFPLVEAIDPQNVIAFKLARDSTKFTGGRYVKTLCNLNRNLSKVICVDSNKDNFLFDNENLFCMQPWGGDDKDTSLLDLVGFLKAIADNDVDDVREVLRVYRKYEDPIAAFRENQRKMIDKLEKEAEVERRQKEKEARWSNFFKLCK